MTYTTYPLGDFLIRIKNAALSGIKEVSVSESKQVVSLAAALKKIYFLEDFSQKEGVLLVKLAYKNKKPILSGLKLVSKPGLRIYMGVSDLEKKKGPSIFLISTSQGVLTSNEALSKRLGGEVIAEIW